MRRTVHQTSKIATGTAAAVRSSGLISAPNSDVLTFKTGGSVIEFEERHSIFGQPGKLRLGTFYNSGNTANYREVTALAAANPALSVAVEAEARRSSPPAARARLTTARCL